MVGMRLEEAKVVDALLTTQWQRLRRWLEETGADHDRRPSVIPGWTVAALVAHLARAMDALAVCAPVPAGTNPVTLAEYLGTYPDRADEIDAITRELAESIADAPLVALDRTAAAAFARLAELRSTPGLAADPAVQARRAPILLSEMVISRLVELVVHGDDLTRSLPRTVPGPLDPAAVSVVSEALLEVIVDRGGWDLEVVDPLVWIRLACGRTPFSVDALAAALQTRSTADSLPDLGARLPIL